MKIISLFTLTLFSSMIAIAQKKSTVFGLYGKCDEGFFTCEQIELKADSTFEYGIFYDVGGWNFYEGKWTMHDNILTFNTFIQPKTKEEFELYYNTYSFLYTDFIVNLKMMLKRRKIYLYDFEKKKISKKICLKKTDPENKKFNK